MNFFFLCPVVSECSVTVFSRKLMGDRRFKSRSLKLNVDGDAVGENALCLKPRRAKSFSISDILIFTKPLLFLRRKRMNFFFF